MFDDEKAQHAIDFIQCLKHTKGRWAGKPFILLDWQYELIRDVFGTVDGRGFRLYRECFCEIPKKNGKSDLAAAVALYLLCADGEAGGEIYSAAGDRKQAGIVFDVAADMVRFEPELDKKCKINDSQKRIIYYPTNSFYQVLSSEVETKHGVNAHGVIFDELHGQPNRNLWDVLTKGSMEAREQPLLFAITTAGYDKESICYEVYDRAWRVKKKVSEDKHFYPVIFELEEKDDWEKEINWQKANPSLGTQQEVDNGTKILSLDRFREAYIKAKENPAEINIFKRLRLNLWTAQETRWLDMHYWNESAGEVHPEELKGKICYAGLDLSSTDDLTAFVLVFNIDDNYKVLPFFFMPGDNIEKRVREHRIKYDVWLSQGHIFATEGNVIDYQFIYDKICEIAKIYEIEEIAYDPYNALMLSQKLKDEGFTMVEMFQGMKSLSPPTKDTEILILSGNLHHGNNPVLTWMFNNVQVVTDANSNRRVDKEKSREKIDGIQAMIMAISRARVHAEPVVYKQDCVKAI
jgi:phage terminase large subunit-like protein